MQKNISEVTMINELLINQLHCKNIFDLRDITKVSFIRTHSCVLHQDSDEVPTCHVNL